MHTMGTGLRMGVVWLDIILNNGQSCPLEVELTTRQQH